MRNLLNRKALVGIAAIWVGIVLGCSEEKPFNEVTGSGPSPIKIDGVIANPKAPNPGDTIVLTAIVTAATSNVGDYVKYEWSATGGTFLENNFTSVRWVAPASASVYSITVKASNSVNQVTHVEAVFVGGLTTVISTNAGEFHFMSTGDTIRYLAGNVFNGFVVRQRIVNTTLLTGSNGFQYTFNRTLTRAAHVVNPGDGWLFVYLDNLVAKTSQPIPPIGGLTPNQYTEPYFSPDGSMLTYQVYLPDQITPANQGGLDSFVVYLYDIAGGMQTRLTADTSHVLNFHPTFSSDGSKLVFVSDRTGQRDWELYSLPVTGGSVKDDTTPGALTKLTSSGGAYGTDAAVPAMRPFAWNPNPADPILAIVDAANQLRLARITGGDVVVSAPGNVRDFRWSADGGMLMISTGESLYLSDKNGVAQLLHSAPTGDVLNRIGWSPDGELAIYSVTRGQSTWFNVIDVGGSTGLQAPLTITSAIAVNNIANYSGVSDVRSKWAPTGRVAYMLLFNGNSPRLASIDLSGL